VRNISWVDDDSAFDLTGFDRYVEEHSIPEEAYPAAFALGHASGRRRHGHSRAVSSRGSAC
jgi:hypothetical protein